MKYQKIIYSMFAVMLSLGSSCFSEDADLLMLETLKNAYENATVPIKFYGKVLDQNSQSLKDVNVTIEVKYYDPTQEFFESNKTIKLLTDVNGKFELSDQGRIIFIEIEKDGYEFIQSENPDMSYKYDPSDAPYQPDVNNPVVFYLHKKNYPAYLTGGGPSMRRASQTRFDVSEGFDAQFYITEGYYDAYGKDGLMPDGTTTLKQDESRGGDKDIHVIGSVSGDNYNITFTPLVANSGLILSDERLEVAPDSGYVNSITISVPTEKFTDSKKYVYARIANASFYSMLDIEISIGGRGDGQVYIEAWTNPASSRNLKYDNEYQDYEEAWRERLSHLHYAATKLEGKSRDDYLKKYDLGEILGIKSDGTFDEALFRLEADALKAKLKAEEPRWWHALE